jgi:hypothetical protein
MKLNSFLALLITSFNCLSQTNQIQSTTNTPTSTQDKQFAAVCKVLPNYFKVDEDKTNNAVSVSLNSPDVIQDLGKEYFKMDMICTTVKSEVIPSEVSLGFFTRAQMTEFSDENTYALYYDGQTVNLSKYNYNYSNNGDGSTSEQYWAQIPFSKFHDVAWAKTVFLRTEHQNLEIPSSVRQKWKLLWNYYTLRNAKHDN